MLEFLHGAARAIPMALRLHEDAPILTDPRNNSLAGKSGRACCPQRAGPWCREHGALWTARPTFFAKDWGEYALDGRGAGRRAGAGLGVTDLGFGLPGRGGRVWAVIVELINTGSELMLGRVLNTHQQWLCRQLADLGYVVSRQVAVPDAGGDIAQAVREALARADLVIATGGLGPTSDDLTRDQIAQLLGKELQEDAAVLAHIRGIFESRGRPMPERTKVQALVPAGALVLPNPHGTAPGLAMEVRPNPFRAGGQPSWLIMLPGPPRELRPMFADSVVPLLRRVSPPTGSFVCRTLRTTGIGESVVEEKVGGPLQGLGKRGTRPRLLRPARPSGCAPGRPRGHCGAMGGGGGGNRSRLARPAHLRRGRRRAGDGDRPAVN